MLDETAIAEEHARIKRSDEDLRAPAEVTAQEKVAGASPTTGTLTEPHGQRWNILFHRGGRLALP